MSSRPTTIISLVMAVFCWSGLGCLMFAFPPDAVGRVLFLSLLFLGVSFSSAPLLLAVHGRLALGPEERGWRRAAAWREAGLIGIYSSLCAWLRFIRVLNWPNALLLAAVLVLTEVLLLARRR